MMAPKYLQATLLKQAVNEAVDRLHDSIDKVEVVGRTVVIHAGAERLTMDYSMWNGDTLGSWGWDITIRNVRPLTLMERLKRFIS
jgi:hypothetical protein